MDFNDAFAVVIGHEGGYVNHPDDPGGETNFGISKRAYPNEDIKGMTLERARMIYRRDYWDKVRGDELPDAIALNVFDMAVNHGVKPAVKILQAAVGAEVDGVIGPRTLAAAWRANPVVAAIRLNASRLDFYTTLTTWSTFGRGWARRVANNLRNIT